METQINQRRGLLILLFFTFFMVVGFDMIMPLVIGHYVNNVGLTATADDRWCLGRSVSGQNTYQRGRISKSSWISDPGIFKCLWDADCCHDIDRPRRSSF